MTGQRIMLQNLYPELASLGIRCFGHYVNKIPQSKLGKEHHEGCYEICYLESGLQPYCIYPSADGEAQMHHLHGGEVFVTRPYEYHSTGGFQQMRGSLYWIQLDSECGRLLQHDEAQTRMLREALAGLDSHVIRVPQSVSGRLTEAFRLMTVRGDSAWMRACALLTLFILELADLSRCMEDELDRRGGVPGGCLEAVSFIRSHLMDPELDVDAVARYLHYSRSYAMTAFRREIGTTIHEYILREKIDCACGLLKTHSVTDTATLLNFSSSQHFSRVFREHAGMTPREYMLSRRAEED